MKSVLFIVFVVFQSMAMAQQRSFNVIPLGVKGGLDESDLSAYLAAPMSSDDYICLDAGTIRSGLAVAMRKGAFGNTDSVLQKHIKGYLVSHGHLDHVAGLIINSPADSKKNIYAFPEIIDVLKTNYFTRSSWTNFGNEGEAPLNKYTYVRLTENLAQPLPGTSMTVVPFRLSHVNPEISSAFLLEANGAQLLYLGDTGADRIEKSGKLFELWKAVAPGIRARKLKGIMIEVSYPNAQPENLLFGHLTPKLLMEELARLDTLAGPGALRGLPVIITHRKPPEAQMKLIESELNQSNRVQVKLIVPEQGQKIEL